MSLGLGSSLSSPAYLNTAYAFTSTSLPESVKAKLKIQMQIKTILFLTYIQALVMTIK